MGVDGFLECLPQQILAAFRVGQVPIDRQDDVVGDEALGCGEEAEIALDHAPLILGEPVLRLPERDVGLHGHLGRHPMIVAAGEILFPRPAIFQRQKLVHVGACIDHALVIDAHARRDRSCRGRWRPLRYNGFRSR